MARKKAVSMQARMAKASKKTSSKTSAKKTSVKAAKTAVKAKSLASSLKGNSLPNKPIAQKQTKAQIYAEIAEIAQVNKAQAKSMVAAIRNIIERHVKAKGSGEVVLPDLGIKVRRVHKKATKAKMGRNPFTGETIQIPAKPARKTVKVSALKSLKALIED